MQNWEQSFTLLPGGQVEISQRDGAVRIFARDGELAVLKAAGEGLVAERLNINSQPNHLEIEVHPERRGWFGWSNHGSTINLELTVPLGTRCRLETGSGLVEVVGGVGAVEIEAGSGSVAVRRSCGPVQIEIGSGLIAIADVEGEVRAETGSGAISVTNARGSVEMGSGSGPLTVSGVKGKQLRLETGSGPVKLDGVDVLNLEAECGSGGISARLAAVHASGKYWIDSGSGAVEILVPPDADLAVDLHAESGRIDCKGLLLGNLRRSQGELSGVAGRGSARLTVETNSGGISLGVGPAQAAPSAAGIAPEVLAAIQSDGALESSREIRHILAMVESGRLTPQEAEEILTALDEEADQA